MFLTGSVFVDRHDSDLQSHMAGDFASLLSHALLRQSPPLNNMESHLPGDVLNQPCVNPYQLEEEGVPRENPCKLHAERPLGWDSNLRPSCNKATVLLKMKCFKKNVII
ncbi:hypothetical protein ILYODFUR_012531 [Ilyodon furcidens]|uniref:Uncharacterized protein n=1 Tax=Ilyodon furcidens TaxID=33524 RepID=A0ABV0SXP4_9TELE